LQASVAMIGSLLPPHCSLPQVYLITHDISWVWICSRFKAAIAYHSTGSWLLFLSYFRFSDRGRDRSRYLLHTEQQTTDISIPIRLNVDRLGKVVLSDRPQRLEQQQTSVCTTTYVMSQVIR
jgi:hypothetical protein